MKKAIIIICAGLALTSAFFISCKKNSDQTTNISTPPLQIGATIADTTSGGTVKGTMVSGKTYHITRDLYVNVGDTLFLQSGVTVCVATNISVFIKGVLISLGTQAAPNYFTSCDPGAQKINTPSQAENTSTDPVWNGGAGWWSGIQCDTTCKLLVLKWTHVDFSGALGDKGILFQNPNGDFIMEDSWMYGGCDDPVRIQLGRISIMRNTFEKGGYIGGDCLNAKSGTVGDMAYNLFVGTATTGTKASNKGGSTIECNVNMYNNTFINGGYRQQQAGRGGDVNYEQGAKGLAYNNLIVNCKYGFRIVGNPIADTANCFYGYNYGYGDSLSVIDQLYPVGYITKPNAYIIPNPANTGYVYNPNGSVAYNDTTDVGKNNPLFVNFPLPETGVVSLADINYVGSYDFHLQSGSPALGKGYTGFSPLNATQVTDPNFRANVTPPNVDIGCYPSDNSGNQH